MTDDNVIIKVLKEAKTIALVGASPKPERASNRVMKFLMDKGYRVIPVNPVNAGQDIHGQTVVADLADIDEPVDMVDIFRRSEQAGAVIDDAIKIGAKTVWTQLDIFAPEAAMRATRAGLNVVQNRCPKIEMPRLGL